MHGNHRAGFKMLSHLGRHEGKIDEFGREEDRNRGQHVAIYVDNNPLRSACEGTSWYVEGVFTLIEIAHMIQVLLEPLSQSQV